MTVKECIEYHKRMAAEFRKGIDYIDSGKVTGSMYQVRRAEYEEHARDHEELVEELERLLRGAK